MEVGLVIYGRLETLTGGYLYDRFLAEALRSRGHRVEVMLDERVQDALQAETEQRSEERVA